MQTVTLGRTGLQAAPAGLGCGGFSRIGLASQGQDHAAGIVRAAYDAGVNFFDTATAYGTQAAVGQGLAGLQRDSYILSTKFPYRGKNADDLTLALETSLRELRTDYVDIYHLHGVAPEDYPQARDIFAPALERLKNEGKIRFAGITEVFGVDTSHRMLQAALPEDLFDVIMVGYNLLNPSAAKTVLPLTREKRVGVLCMFAVRSALSRPEQLRVDIRRILDRGQADPARLDAGETLDFLTQTGAAASIMDAAYRFCRHTPGIDVVLTGTGSAAHLAANLASIQGPPLPAEILDRLESLFGGVDCISGQ
jgi:aryl-alcohol dehydrogenase-like predicted oxidoreductase